MSRYIDADELKRNHMFYHEADNRSYAEERDIGETPFNTYYFDRAEE